mgnify:CR=1 FL=1
MRGPLPQSAYDYGARASGGTHGVVLTRPQVVELILDLVGYTPERELGAQVLLEPACGRGAFVLPAVRRLLESARRTARCPGELAPALRAYDVDPAQAAACRQAVVRLLGRHGVAAAKARALAAAWIRHADFLLADELPPADYVVGNPPYVRIEQLAPVLQAEYRRRLTSFYDRADLYVAFMERSLKLLSPAGTLSFICADRFTRNRYGAPLRRLITQDYALRCYIDLHKTAPFTSAVAAYPCILVIAQKPVPEPAVPAPVVVMSLAQAGAKQCAAVLPLLRGERTSSPGIDLSYYPRFFHGVAPWVLSTPAHLAVLRQLEERFAPIEQVGGARVGIGVATGCDRIYIVDRGAAIEPDRLLPLVHRDDLRDGRVRDGGRCVINTFDDTGRPVDLARYPLLSAYLAAHEPELRKRHIARKNPAAWFRTIDRVYPELVQTPKLLFPDIAAAGAPILEPGRAHPHHNLYFITAASCDLEVYGGLLSSKVALFFIWSYAVKLRGGYLRFQAQYLRRVRIPAPAALAPELSAALRQAFRRRDFPALDALSLKAYELPQLPDFPFIDTRR